MAKKKSASAATQSLAPAPEKPTKAAKKTPSAKDSANGDASSAAGVLGTDQIGATAGAVWLLLTEQGDLSLATIKKEIAAPADLILAAIGWLAREEKLDFTVSGKNVKLALK